MGYSSTYDDVMAQIRHNYGVAGAQLYVHAMTCSHYMHDNTLLLTNVWRGASRSRYHLPGQRWRSGIGCPFGSVPTGPQCDQVRSSVPPRYRDRVFGRPIRTREQGDAAIRNTRLVDQIASTIVTSFRGRYETPRPTHPRPHAQSVLTHHFDVVPAS